jgi:hypothetical protein
VTFIAVTLQLLGALTLGRIDHDLRRWRRQGWADRRDARRRWRHAGTQYTAKGHDHPCAWFNYLIRHVWCNHMLDETTRFPKG